MPPNRGLTEQRRGIKMIERKITVNIEPTPEELAFAFCNFGEDGQADFFNEVAVISEKWVNPFCFQLQYVTDNERLTVDGRRVMESIGEYGQDEYQERIRNAAPGLLEALEQLIECPELEYSYTHSHVVKARAAIASAKGE